MGLRFRKSIKIAPGVKVNLNKNSTSVSVGTKGKHYTVNSNGKTTKTIGIPGTGLSYSTTSSNKPKKASKKTKVSNEKKSKTKKKHGCLTPFLVVFAAFLLFAMIPSGDKKTEEPPKKQITEEQAASNTTSHSEDAEDTDENTPEANPDLSEQERIAAEQAAAEQAEAERAEAERITAEQAGAQRVAAEQVQSEAAQPQNPENNFNAYNNPEQQTTSSYVLNTNTMKFHYPTCDDVEKIAPHNYSTYDGTRDSVIGQGYSPCGHCNP